VKAGDLVVRIDVMKASPTVAHYFCTEVLGPVAMSVESGTSQLWVAKLGAWKIYVSDADHCIWKTYEQVVAEAMT